MYLKVLSPLRHDGKRYQPGDVLEMDNKQAAALIVDGIAEKTDKPKTVKEPLKPSETDKAKAAEKPSSDSAASSGNDQAPEDEQQNSGEDDAASAE